MVYDFQTRLDILGSRMREINKKTVVYTIIDTVTFNPLLDENVSIEATLGRTETQEQAPSGSITIGSLRDYIVSTIQLVDGNGNAFLPKRGDVITDGTLTMQVMSAGDEPPYQWTTATRKRLRIHTQITTAP